MVVGGERLCHGGGFGARHHPGHELRLPHGAVGGAGVVRGRRGYAQRAPAGGVATGGLARHGLAPAQGSAEPRTSINQPMTDTLALKETPLAVAPEHRRGSRSLPYLLAAGGYLALSILVWWHVWSTHPTAVTTCGCGDPSAAIWYTSWPAYALSHGLNPLFSSAVGYPTGVNLVFAAYGVVLAPLTWLFGPVAALNVGLTLAPVLSALAMFALARRWVSFPPAAFVAGLLYGFSPFVLANVTTAHVDFSMVAIPPLVVICLDELLVRQRHRPAVTGVVLGVLLSAQFLVGTEVLILLVLEVVFAAVLMAAYTYWRRPELLRARVRPALRGTIVAGVTAAA